MKAETIGNVLETVRRQSLPADDREYVVALHDYVRDRVRFGFTTGFEGVTPEQTLAMARGHCNAQADLLCALLRGAGFDAGLRFVALDKRILRHAVPAPVLLCLPSRLFHAVTRVQLDGRCFHIDSYIFDRPGFRQQQRRLRASGLERGYGLGRGAGCEWAGRADAFSQAEPGDLRADNPQFPTLAAAVASRAGNNTLLGIHFNQWLGCVPGPLRRASERYLNSRLGPAMT
ncbi:transglutaminase-like domain-containing protein [Chromobacterium phragmitis]|uniref:Transglutaminase-like domain-containing protein n=1 Tax=Chromobacterium phragmitis TaxID=2202141 RepID=A0ABV0IYR6_9NEIS